MTHWSKWDRWKCAQSTEEKELVGQHDWRSPVEHALDEKIHASREVVKGFASPHLEAD